MYRYASAALFTLVVTLVCGDWFIARTTAQPGENRTGDVNAAAPTQIPATAFLTGMTLQHASVDDVDLSLEGSPDAGFVLVLHNRGVGKHVSDFEVDCLQQTGSPLSRMRPIPRVVHTEHVRVELAAGATVRRRLEVELDAPPADRAPMGFAAFTSTSFQLRRPGTDAGDAPLAVLRWSDTPAEAG
jgi:hypothetical protein